MLAWAGVVKVGSAAAGVAREFCRGCWSCRWWLGLSVVPSQALVVLTPVGGFSVAVVGSLPLRARILKIMKLRFLS